RNGVAPSLELSYSSQAPLRGGIAAGWSLELPSITLVATRGGGPDHWVVQGLPSSGRLVAVPDTAMHGGTMYRAEFDDGFVRFENVAATGVWYAYTPDG